MKALLICPGFRAEVSALSRDKPLVLAPILGSNLVALWLEHLAGRGTQDVILLATDRPEEVRAFVGDGARWGMRVMVSPESRELTLQEARAKYKAAGRGGGASALDVMVLMDHLPHGAERRMLGGYRAWYEGVVNLLGQPPAPSWIGMRETRPGVWVSRRAVIAPGARLEGPCWVGEDVRVETGTVVGPGSVIEPRAWLEAGCVVERSLVGPETLVGSGLELRESVASGGQLTHWRRGSTTRVMDSFILCSLRPRRLRSAPGQWLGRLVAMGVMGLTLPVAAWFVVLAKLRRRPVFRSFLAVRPGRNLGTDPETLLVYELSEGRGGVRRWPQLWHVARGEFAWVGNRPLSPSQAAELTTEFERLWLAAPTGLISHGDAQGCPDTLSEEARAHATFYSVQACRKLRLKILATFLKRKILPHQRHPETP